MEIKENDNLCIIAPLSAKLNEYESSRVISEILKESRSVALDLNYVQDCTIDFIEKLKAVCQTKRIGIFNIPSDIFVLFNIMKIDKIANIYVSELDFEENSRQIINRCFQVV